jgi:hypothetical protein
MVTDGNSAADTELFFLETKTPPQDLRIRLSPGLVALGKAHAAAQPPAPDDGGSSMSSSG